MSYQTNSNNQKQFIMETYVVLMEVGYHDARKKCELIQGSTIKIELPNGGNEFTRNGEVDKKIDELVNDDESSFECYPMNDFMDLFNDEQINADNYFMSYVTVDVSDISLLNNK